jgi:hypothetical protein
MSAIPARAAENEEPENNTPDLDAEFDAIEGDAGDDLADELNNPDIVHLGDAPTVGGRTRSVDLFGEQADYVAGRVTSPKLYAQAAQFPTCAQLRVWKWENGIPVGLGTIESTATEEEFVARFFTAMPKKGEARAQFKLRPIDMRGQELGQEVTIVISEHHAAIRTVREAEEEERERGSNPYAFMPPPQSNDMSSEMSRMVEHMLATAETRSKALEEALEAERERIRQEELRRTQERVDLATNAAQGVQVITERMMKDESVRAERAARMQSEQSQLLITTLTSIFAQQQSMAQQAAEAARRADEYRIEQERQRADRERIAAEERRKLEMQEAEYRRAREREEAEFRLRLEREESERKRIESERLVEQRRAELELRLAREREEAEARRRADELKLQHEREDAHRRFEAARLELELKLNREREEMERKERRERDEAERREKWFAEERARRESREAAEAREREQERQRQHERMVKELELQAQKDREHAERMIALQKAEGNANNGDVLANAAKLFGQFGVPPDQIFKRLFTPESTGGDDDDGEEKGGWMDMVGKILPVVGEVARAAANRSAQAPAAQGPGSGQRMEISPEQMAELQRQQAPRQRAGDRRLLPNNAPEQFAMPRQRPREPLRRPEQEMTDTVERALAEAALTPTSGPAVEAPVVEAPQAQEIIPAPPEGVIVPTVQPEYDGSEAPQPPAQDGQIPVSLSDLAAAKNLPLKAQKAARIGIRKLVKKIEAAPEESWEEIIGTAVATEVNIYHYVDAVSVNAAIREGGASPELTARIIAAMRRSALIPENFNYGSEA